jgi:hypothetical protein
MGSTVPAYVPLRPIDDSSHTGNSDSKSSVSSLYFPPRQPLLPPPNKNEDFANVHGSLAPLLDQITAHTAIRAGKIVKYITFSSPPFQHLEFDDVRSHYHMATMARFLLSTDHGDPSVAAAKGYLSQVSANRRDYKVYPTRFYNVQGKEYQVLITFIPRRCEIRFRKIPVVGPSSPVQYAGCADRARRVPEEPEEVENLEKWTDVVRFHVGDSAMFLRMVHWDETAPDALGDKEGPWTKEEVKKREGPCWRHGKRGVPHMGPCDDGDNIDWRQSG